MAHPNPVAGEGARARMSKGHMQATNAWAGMQGENLRAYKQCHKRPHKNRPQSRGCARWRGCLSVRVGAAECAANSRRCNRTVVQVEPVTLGLLDLGLLV